MKRFALKLLLFASLFLAFDKIFILVANRSAEAEVDKRLEYLVKGEINKDIIVIGSSRGARGIIASQIERETGLSAYNLCYPGSNVEFHDYIIRTLIEFNDPPSIALLVVDDNTEFFYDSTITFRKDRLYPLVKYHWIREELIVLGDKDKFLSKFLVLHQLNKVNFDLRTKTFTPLDTIMPCGSMPVSWKKQGTDAHLTMEYESYFTDKEVVEYVEAYKEIINTCTLNNISLVVVFPPLSRTHSTAFEERIRELSDANTKIYVYDTTNPAYRNRDYYHEGGHLIRRGAEIFTDELNLYIGDLIYTGDL